MKSTFKMSGILACILLFFTGPAFSQQDYPVKPVTMIHGFSAGGNTDLSVRILGEALSKVFGQPFVTVPKPGAGQTIAVSILAKSDPDGYTIGHFYQGVFSRVPLMQSVPYKLEDFEPLIGWQYSPLVIACRSDAPYKNLKELAAKAKTESITFGHNGKASGLYVLPVLFAKQAGIKLLDVPFKGDADQMASLIGGHIKLAVVTEVAAAPFLDSGQARALCACTKQRLTYHPEIPTMEEQGFDMPLLPPTGMAFVPKGTPNAIMMKLHDGIRSSISDPKVKAEFDRIKQNLTYVDPKTMIEFIKKEKGAYYPIFKDLGLAK